MANLTQNENYRISEVQECTVHAPRAPFVSFNIFLSIAETLGDVLILVAHFSQEVVFSSAPSKLIFRFLANDH